MMNLNNLTRSIESLNKPEYVHYGMDMVEIHAKDFKKNIISKVEDIRASEFSPDLVRKLLDMSRTLSSTLGLFHGITQQLSMRVGADSIILEGNVPRVISSVIPSMKTHVDFVDFI